MGYSGPVFGSEAFRWTSAGGVVGLGDLPGGDFDSVAYTVSADGSVVVGYSESGETVSGLAAFIWDETNGMRDLKDVLTNDCGLDLTGWDLLEAFGVSDDGLTIVGTGFSPSDNGEGWIAVLPEPANPVPSISFGGLALLAGLFMGTADRLLRRGRSRAAG